MNMFLGEKEHGPTHSDWTFECLTHMAVLKDQKSALQMASRLSYEKIDETIIHCR